MVREFVSISGVSDENQLREIYRTCREEDINFKVAIGYQVSNKSINQGTKNPRQPRFKDLENLNNVAFDCGFIPAIHYYTKDPRTIIRDLEVIAEKSSPNLSLFQFNTLPPSLEVLKKSKEIGFKIIFTVAVSNKQSPQRGYAVWRGNGVQDVKTGEVKPLMKQVQERKDFIDYIMFDPSHGTNLELDLEEDSLPIKFGKDITKKTELNNLGLVYAGGIKPTNVESVTRSLLSFFPQERVSIDVESGVREGNDLNIDLIRRYLLNYKLAFNDFQ